jgi:hypothetical protein
MVCLRLDLLGSTRKERRMHRGQTLPSVTVAFMQESDRFSQTEMIFLGELFHAANGGPAGTLGVILGLREHCDSNVNELVHGADESTFDSFLNRALLFRRELYLWS